MHPSVENKIKLQAMKSTDDSALLRKTPLAGESSVSSRISEDARLERLGKKPRLNRSFGFMSILGFSCSALLSWEGVLVNSVTALLNGGPAGVIWGFLINWIGTISVYAVLGELTSIAPTAAGQCNPPHPLSIFSELELTFLSIIQDHWVAILAPKSYSTFLAYITAWLTTMAWQAICVSSCYLIATLLQGIVVLSHPQYQPTSWQTVLIIWAVSLFAVGINSTTGRALAKFEGLVLIAHLVGFFGILIPMVYLAPHNDPSMVFTTFLNERGWPNQALSFLVGFPSGATSLLGADCAVHLSEEIQSSATVVPRAIMYTIFINGTLAFSALIGMLFCLTDIESALEASHTIFYPFLQVFYSAVKSRSGACAMASLILVLAIASTVGIYASASRMLWSFSRDKGLPFSSFLVKVRLYDFLPGSHAPFINIMISLPSSPFHLHRFWSLSWSLCCCL